jgi:hypothetical protein
MNGLSFAAADVLPATDHLCLLSGIAPSPASMPALGGLLSVVAEQPG